MRYAKTLRNKWEFWLTISVALIAALAAVGSCTASFKGVPSSEEIAKGVNPVDVAAHINLDELAKIIQKSSKTLTKEELAKPVAARLPIPPQKPNPVDVKKANQVKSVSMTKLLASCVMLAAQTYSVPPAVLVGMYEVEGGRVAREVGPYSDGSYLLGPMNISSNLIPELSDKWGVEPKIAYKWVKYDPCTNFGVSAWILRKHMNETGSLAQSIEEYGSGPLGEGEIYKKQVVDAMRKKGLLRDKAEID